MPSTDPNGRIVAATPPDAPAVRATEPSSSVAATPRPRPEGRCRTPFTLWALSYVILMFGGPLAAVVAVSDVLPPGRGWAAGFAVVAPVLYAVLFGVAAGLLSLPHHKSVQPGTFPRDLRLPSYRGRRLYGLCWTAVYYFTPVYWLFLSISPLKRLLFRLFGYRGATDFTVYPDTWIRDLPLLELGPGAYVSNKATLGTNVCLNDGTILVDRITLKAGAMVGHLSMLAPGVVMEERSEIGIGTAIGIKARLGPRVSVGGICTVSHLTVLEEGVSTGTAVDVGAAVRIGPGIHIRPGSFVPNRTRWKTQADADRALDAVPVAGSGSGAGLAERNAMPVASADRPAALRASASHEVLAPVDGQRFEGEPVDGKPSHGGATAEMRLHWNQFE